MFRSTVDSNTFGAAKELLQAAAYGPLAVLASNHKTLPVTLQKIFYVSGLGTVKMTITHSIRTDSCKTFIGRKGEKYS